MRYKVYETCIAEFSTIIEAKSAKEAKKNFNKRKPALKLEEICERLDGTTLVVHKLVPKI